MITAWKNARLLGKLWQSDTPALETQGNKVTRDGEMSVFSVTVMLDKRRW